MEISKALDLLEEYSGELDYLRSLTYNNNEQRLWKNKVKVVVEAAFGKNSDEYKYFTPSITSVPMFRTEEGEQKRYLEDLGKYEIGIQEILQKYEILEIEEKPAVIEEPKDTTESSFYLFDKMQFHPRVIATSKLLFRDGHYASAILEAYKAINNLVKEKTSLALDGKALMSQAFSETNPIIKLTKLKTQSDRDEQEGFKFLFMGAMVGIRNPKAHDNIIQTDPYRTLEYLAFASLLMKRIEEGEL
ncbi:MAG: TIGR02391 family protein [Dehalococcoidales bacterium]|nr:TIGR02391 family protein [Dehalococcoidales bacterium]